MSLPTASNSPGDATGHQGLGTGAKAGVGVGVAISVLSIMGLIVFLILYHRNRPSRPNRSQSEKRSHLIISGSTEVEPKSTGGEIDSNPVHEADGSMFAGHELDGSPPKLELESRSNWPCGDRRAWSMAKREGCFAVRSLVAALVMIPLTRYEDCISYLVTPRVLNHRLALVDLRTEFCI
jgi:hypothetical protein